MRQRPPVSRATPVSCIEASSDPLSSGHPVLPAPSHSSVLRSPVRMGATYLSHRARHLAKAPSMGMKYLHTMVRVTDLEQSLDFFCKKLGMVQIGRSENEKGRYTLVFLA